MTDAGPGPGSGAGGRGSGPPEIAVVGSINLDLALDVERFPDPGETVLGLGVARGGGGKGANQAVAAARLGRSVALVGRLGDDGDGHQLRHALAAEGLDLTAVETADAPTGLAVIEVDPSGENRIVVVPGANAAVTVEQLDRAGPTIDRAAVVLAQLEIPVEVVEALARRPRQGTFVLNPAPARPVDLTGVDVVVPNRTELALLAGGEPAVGVAEVVDQLRAVPQVPPSAVVTLGGDGAVVVTGLGGSRLGVEEVPANAVDVVDTTGAGDAFCGGLADALCLGADLVAAANWAGRVAAVAVTRPGAWSALPRRAELLA
ncbi:MAG: ribokinase [Actinomycetota bacterium]